MELLEKHGALLASRKIEHTYPHCWRCHKPTIFRATEQWFIGMDRNNLRQNALQAVRGVKWMPAWGESRIGNMIAERPDWCISRQRIWGVPIIVFYCETCREPYTERKSLDAVVELVSHANGARVARSVPLASFFTGPGKTVRTPFELVVGVRIPLPPAGHVARFCKFGTRPALDISAVSIGIAGVRGGNRLSRVRVAFGAVAPTPMRAPCTEAALEGRALVAATIAAAAAVARDEVRPISDVRASDWYRRELIHNLTRRVLDDVAHA
jgi:hypothetical protein